MIKGTSVPQLSANSVNSISSKLSWTPPAALGINRTRLTVVQLYLALIN